MEESNRSNSRENGPISHYFKFEMSPDGNNWSTVMDGKATKKKLKRPRRANLAGVVDRLDVPYCASIGKLTLGNRQIL
jgi:hypothetical protein